MHERDWTSLVAGVQGGKRVGESLYLHVSALPPLLADVVQAVAMARAPYADFNVVKLTLGRPRLSLLSYPRFFEEGFPVLANAWTINLDGDDAEHRSYLDDPNPPVLHRKELLLGSGDPRRPALEALTQAAEQRGLFDDPAIIGHRFQWEEELRARSLRVDGHHLIEVGDTPLVEAPPDIARHRTALSRRSLSTPMQALWRHGYLDGRHTVFDYGCGRGDDMAALRDRHVSVEGWDPHFRAEGVRAPADVVNLGFVLNVIEDLCERSGALATAFELARHVLAVAALIGGRTAWERHRLFRDGVLTSRGTFQKYFTHAELGAYIADVLGREPVGIAPGLYFVFRNDEAEQEFLERRVRSRVRTPAPVPRPAPRAVPPRPVRPKAPAPPLPPRRASRWEKYASLVEAFWAECLALGRSPLDTEFAQMPELRHRVGTPERVLRHLLEQYGANALETARVRRRGDLSVFLALNLFERRRSFTALPQHIQTDIRELWGAYPRALEEAKALLFSLRETETVAQECAAAATAWRGKLVPNDALYLDARLANELPPALRLYIGCGARLYGEVQEADVVKIHIGSGKLSVMAYDDYAGLAIPLLIERVKIDLRRQQVHYFEYGDEFPPQPLYFKSEYMNADCDGYDAQCAFDEQLRRLEQFDWSGFGPPLEDVAPHLAQLSLPEGLALPQLPRTKPTE
jgi:DNA phosphorothioation-associated putative methyltransferase